VSNVVLTFKKCVGPVRAQLYLSNVWLVPCLCCGASGFPESPGPGKNLYDLRDSVLAGTLRITFRHRTLPTESKRLRPSATVPLFPLQSYEVLFPHFRLRCTCFEHVVRSASHKNSMFVVLSTFICAHVCSTVSGPSTIKIEVSQKLPN